MDILEKFLEKTEHYSFPLNAENLRDFQTKLSRAINLHVHHLLKKWYKNDENFADFWPNIKDLYNDFDTAYCEHNYKFANFSLQTDDYTIYGVFRVSVSPIVYFSQWIIGQYNNNYKSAFIADTLDDFELCLLDDFVTVERILSKFLGYNNHYNLDYNLDVIALNNTSNYNLMNIVNSDNGNTIFWQITEE